ncbi:MAG: response regulator [Woeseia sp.]|nr:response regulator [Woeseia sp.]
MSAATRASLYLGALSSFVSKKKGRARQVNSSIADPAVFVVDDDQAIRYAMEMLLRSVNLPHRIFDSGAAFLAQYDAKCRGCLVLDIRMPGMGGLELQQELAQRGSSLPIIFITGFGDIPMAVEALQNGAFDFIEKPFRDQELLDRIGKAMEVDAAQSNRQKILQGTRERLARLTPREREVFDLVVTGKANKVIAHQLSVSQRTVEIHRARVMEKMEARSLADLVRMQLEA